MRFKIRTNEKLTKKINSDITETVDACELCHKNEGEYYGKAAVRSEEHTSELQSLSC